MPVVGVLRLQPNPKPHDLSALMIHQKCRALSLAARRFPHRAHPLGESCLAFQTRAAVRDLTHLLPFALLSTTGTVNFRPAVECTRTVDYLSQRQSVHC